jgi:hypothetical protein
MTPLKFLLWIAFAIGFCLAEIHPSSLVTIVSGHQVQHHKRQGQLPDPRSELIIMFREKEPNAAAIQSSIQLTVLDKYGAKIVPLWQGAAEDSPMKKFYTIYGAKPENMAAIIREIRARGDVQTAYISPPPTRPGGSNTRPGPPSPRPTRPHSAG